MDTDKMMDTAKEGAKAITKLQEIILNIFGPRWIKKQADAQRYSDEKKLQTIRENPDMEIEFVDGKMNAKLRTPEALKYRAEQRMLAESVRQEENIENILKIVAEILQDSKNVSNESVDEDWITRFFEITKNISADDMQFIWGKILAGEIVNPGSFSLRTLEVLRNISRKEAQIFQKVMPLIMGGEEVLLFTDDNDILNKYGILYSDVLLLSDCGLVSNGTSSINDFFNKDKVLYLYNGKFIIKLSGKTDVSLPIRINVHLLTKAGCEIYRVLSHNNNKEFVLDFAKNIYDSYSNELSVIVYEKVFKSENMDDFTGVCIQRYD